jgi:hypothetical protein
MIVCRATKERFEALNEWLDDFNLKCPQKTTKKNTASSTDNLYAMNCANTGELQKLRSQVAELRVDLPAEVSRIDEVSETFSVFVSQQFCML